MRLRVQIWQWNLAWVQGLYTLSGKMARIQWGPYNWGIEHDVIYQNWFFDTRIREIPVPRTGIQCCNKSLRTRHGLESENWSPNHSSVNCKPDLMLSLQEVGWNSLNSHTVTSMFFWSYRTAIIQNGNYPRALIPGSENHESLSLKLAIS